MMKVSSLLPLIIVLLFSLVACTTKSTETLSDTQLALHASVDFLESLHAGRYEESAQLYGGTYEVMMGHNPSIDPANYAALLRNACTINGTQCLDVRSAGLDTEVSATEFIFKVEFQNQDGTLFVVGPCCGESETDFPPQSTIYQSTFLFRVVKVSEGKFLVMNMPPYMP
jgi:hypothetical protein